jgi:hypothetical protein
MRTSPLFEVAPLTLKSPGALQRLQIGLPSCRARRTGV